MANGAPGPVSGGGVSIIARPSVADLRRREILDAARAVVAERGLGALTFGALEGRLAFTRGVITHHFANKQAIVHALLDDALAEIDRATAESIAAASPVSNRIHAALCGMVRGFSEHSEATRVLVSFWGLQGVDARAAQKNAALFERYREECRSLLRVGQARGEVRADLDVDAVAAVLVGLVIGIVAQGFFEPGRVDVERAVAAAAEGVILAAC
ncbi:MAG: TetR/AcrR family transcriptional regulator [Myxococcota bacterium]